MLDDSAGVLNSIYHLARRGAGLPSSGGKSRGAPRLSGASSLVVRLCSFFKALSSLRTASNSVFKAISSCSLFARVSINGSSDVLEEMGSKIRWLHCLQYSVLVFCLD